MFKDMAYYLRIGNEADDLHLPSAARTRKGVRLIDLFDTFTPLDTRHIAVSSQIQPHDIVEGTR
jgi:hypothetical protein